MLSNRDRRRLADIERQLSEEDPVLDQKLSNGSATRHARYWPWYASLGLVAFCAGALAEDVTLLVLGFASLVFGALLGLMLWGERIRAAEDPENGKDPH